jgi:hypothetical protein
MGGKEGVCENILGRRKSDIHFGQKIFVGSGMEALFLGVVLSPELAFFEGDHGW